jgi:hypothetical protein
MDCDWAGVYILDVKSNFHLCFLHSRQQSHSEAVQDDGVAKRVLKYMMVLASE